ncbi:O-antigen ligase family protein [uncultured Algibacter sp.]|uniref:O-antigen ligase family protein n=1 Tax=uncultured Algibacter sp. TaxID=298659 RepID=UPI00262750DB|nr:O-antigen ligase family protein [uncultured Algibacter sp.]
MNILKLNVNNLLVYGIISFGTFPLLPDRLKVILTGYLVVFSMILAINTKFKKINYQTFLINSSLFFVLAISLVYTNNISRGFKFVFETRISSIIFPLIFLFISNRKDILNNQVIRKVKRIYIISCLLYCFIFYLFLLIYQQSSFNSVSILPTFVFTRNTMIDIPVIGNHPIYSSIYLGIAIIFLKPFKFLNKKSKKIEFLFFLVFVITLLLLSSKMVIISLLLTGFVYLLKSKTYSKSIKIKVIASILILIFLSLKFSPLKYRFNELFNKETYEKFDRSKSTSIRVAIYKCGIQVIDKNIAIGTGVGDVQEELNSCYEGFSYYLVDNNFNIHNQYLSVFIATGVIGLMFFLFFLFFNYRKSLKLKDETYIYILLFYSLNMMTENILERQNGIMLFYFFVCLFSQSKKNIRIN